MIYHPEKLDQNQHITLTPLESHHLIKVLRKKVGQNVSISNGKGGLGKGVILSQERNIATVKITTVKNHPIPQKIHLVFCPPKSSDRLRFLLEKITELGVSSMHPIISKHSERKGLNMEKCQSTLVAALKQSQSPFLPKLHPIDSFQNFLKTKPQPLWIAHCRDTQQKKTTLKDIDLNRDVSPFIMIGPEGDFSDEEIEKAIENGGKNLSLGGFKLRTETAAIYACSVLQFLRNTQKIK